ncbi:MAG: type 4a pilus biogenesis protein PilO [Candidatus Omnitrophota bacterium]
MMKLKREQSVGIALGAAAGMGLGLYFLLFNPLIGKLNSAGMEWSAVESKLLRAHDSISSLELMAVKKELIVENELSRAIDELTRQGRTKDVNFVSITPGQIEAAKEPPYRVCPLNIEIESTYEQLAGFLGALDESGKNIITVRNFNMAPIQEGSEKIKTTLTLNMYISGKKNAE